MEFDDDEMRVFAQRIAKASARIPPSRVLHAFRMLAGPTPDPLVAEYRDQGVDVPRASWTLVGMRGRLLVCVRGSADAPRGWVWENEQNGLFGTDVNVESWAQSASDLKFAIDAVDSQSDWGGRPAFGTARATWAIETRFGDRVTLPPGPAHADSVEALISLLLARAAGSD